MAISSERKVDYLEIDDQIPGQKYVLLSMILPQSLVQKRELFYVSEFFKKICSKLEIDENKATELLNDFQSFKELNGSDIDEKFAEQNDHQTSVTALKVRGSYETQREAEFRARKLQKQDPDFNVFVAEIGKWLPISPSIEYHIENEKYLESQLQDLMANYKDNLRLKDDYFEERKRDEIKRARERSEDPGPSSTQSHLPTVTLGSDSIIDSADHTANKESFTQSAQDD